MATYTSFTAEETKAIADRFWLPRMICPPAGGIGCYLIAFPWPSDNPFVVLFWTLFEAYALFFWTSCFHETAHQTLTSFKWFNVALGRILGTAMYVPYTVYRESHIRHHANLNKPNDWELWPYADPTSPLWFRRIFVWFDLLLGVYGSPIVYGRIYFHRDSPIKSPAIRRRIRNEYFAIVIFWVFAFSVITYSGAWWGFFKIWWIPTAIAGICQTVRKLTEHLGMSSYDPMLGTRTVLGTNWMTRLGTFINFDLFIHGPHHRHPRVSHNLLKQKMLSYIQENPDKEFPVYTTYFRAILAMIPFLFGNPGCGMNAGARYPGKPKNEDVQDFVADVAEEVIASNDLVLSTGSYT